MHTRDYRLLANFVAVVDAGSITAAARKNHVSVPVVSKALSDLEEVLNRSLLTRARGKQRLTESGAVLYPLAVDMVSLASEAMECFRNPDDPVAGSLSVTMPTEISVSWFPDVYRGFREAYPGVDVRVNASDEVQDLDASEFDIAIRAKFFLRQMDQPRLDNVITRLPLALVAAPFVQQERSGSMVNRLEKLPFIGFGQGTGNSCFPVYNKKTRQQSTVQIQARVNVNSAIIARELAKEGIGVARVIELSARDAISKGQLIKLASNLDIGYVSLFYELRDRHPAAYVSAFADYCLATSRTN